MRSWHHPHVVRAHGAEGPPAIGEGAELRAVGVERQDPVVDLEQEADGRRAAAHRYRGRQIDCGLRPIRERIIFLKCVLESAVLICPGGCLPSPGAFTFGWWPSPGPRRSARRTLPRISLRIGTALTAAVSIRLSGVNGLEDIRVPLDRTITSHFSCVGNTLLILRDIRPAATPKGQCGWRSEWLRNKKTGGYTARKVIPKDVRGAVRSATAAAGRNGFSAPSSKSPARAKALFSAWQAKMDNRIAAPAC